MSEELVRLLLAYIDQRIEEVCAHADGDTNLRDACYEIAEGYRAMVVEQARADLLKSRID